MKKQVIYFLTILVALISLIGLLLEEAAYMFDPNEPKIKEILEFKNKEFDVLFLGNSITQQGINPTIIDSSLNVNSYNMAVGGGNIFENEILLRHYIKSNKKPQKIIYGLFINESRWGENLRPTIIHGINKDIYQTYEEYFENHNIPIDYSLQLYNKFSIFRHRSVIEHILKYIIDSKNRNYTYLKGFVRSTIINKMPEKLMPHTSGININALKSFDTFCNNEGIKVCYVELPNSEIFNKTTLKRSTTIAEINKVISDSLMSFNLNVDHYTIDDWSGLNHLNVKGAEKFTIALANRLEHQK
ncbi:MAG: hypothetical protein HND50_00195 [Calditrichaeota bacterium]|nr:hypothetical protein [Calditrichota bacterium]